jgi:hypothetical protein
MCVLAKLQFSYTQFMNDYEKQRAKHADLESMIQQCSSIKLFTGKYFKHCMYLSSFIFMFKHCIPS